MKRRVKPSIFRDVYDQPYSDNIRLKLCNSSKGSLNLIQRLRLMKSLPVHGGCVNSICWNETGEYILSGSDDQHLVVTHGYNYKVLTDLKTSHRANIFSAKFLPNSGDTSIISCSGDGIILYTDLHCKEDTYYNQFNCHSGTTYEVITVPGDAHSFLSCGEDGTVRWFDLRLKDKCSKPQCKEDILMTCQRAVTALCVNPMAPYQLAIGCSDSTVRMFDRRMLGTKLSGGESSGSLRPLCSFTVPSFEDRSYRITSLCFSPEGEDILVSYSSDHLYLFSVKDHSGLQLKTTSLEPSKERSKRVRGQRSPPPVRRLRLRGDWSDTGPDARPEREGGRRGEVAQARPTLHATLMQRMTDVLSRMLNDPATRAALSGGGGDSLEMDEGRGAEEAQTDAPQTTNSVESEQPTTSSISVPPIDSLSINPPRDVSTEGAPVNESGAIDLSPITDLPEAESERCEMAAGFVGGPVLTDASVTHVNDPAVASGSQHVASASGSQHVASSACLSSNSGTIEHNISNLQDQLSNMREGFIERHGSEPSVSLVFSDKSTTHATISLGVGDEVSRSLHPVAGGESSGTASGQAGPSTQHQARPPAEDDSDLEVDEFDDSDDDDLQVSASSRRFIHPIDRHMDEAIAAARHDKEMMFDEHSIVQPAVKQKYTGHRNARTMIKEASFWGSDFVLSGSDCGHVFVWERHGGRLAMLLQADNHVVNCVQPHPTLPLLATSGIDHDVKLWAPLHSDPCFDADLAEVLMKRNEVMLEETKDTITVPASFMIRMLACLNQIRRGRNRTRNSRRQNAGDTPNSNN